MTEIDLGMGFQLLKIALESDSHDWLTHAEGSILPVDWPLEELNGKLSKENGRGFDVYPAEGGARVKIHPH